MEILILSFSALFGLVIGSFLNAVIYRIPRNETLNTRSHCPKCDSMITAWQNIPLISYLVLGGKCKNCRTRISIRYPLIEAITAVFFVVVAWWVMNHYIPEATDMMISSMSNLWGIISIIAALCIFAASSVALSVIDYETQTLPTKIIYTAILLILPLYGAGALLTDGLMIGDTLWVGILSSLSLFGFYFITWFIKPKAMGFGDVRLALLLGLVAGFIAWESVLFGGFAAFLLAGVFGIGLMIFNKAANRKTAIPFGPWMLIGMWIGIFWGEQVIDIYLRFSGLR